MIKSTAIVLFTLSSLLFFNQTNADIVTSSDRNILVNGKKYVIKGVCYNPVPRGEHNRSFENISVDLNLMKEAGINTIRVYSPIDDREILDLIDKAGIKVIIGFGYNQNGNFDIQSGTFINYIDNYKNHNAILMWELGNEYNYHPEWFNDSIQTWYSAMNNAAGMIKEIDENHLVTTAHGELPDMEIIDFCDQIDVWGMNVYRWDNPEEIFIQWKALSEKPMYLSEAGADSYMVESRNDFKSGENQKAQAMAVDNILDDIFRFSDICSGVTLFAFVDELWKAGNNDSYDTGGWAPNSSGVPYDGAANEEYWGIVDIDKNKKLSFEVVKKYYNK